MMRLCLGTVQFGGDYGIRGGRKPSVEDAVRMLNYATQNGVDAIDTAAAYGSAEEVVGEFLGRRTVLRDRLFIVSKFGTDVFEGVAPGEWGAALSAALARSLKRLKTDYLDAYVCHVATAVSNAAICEAMVQAKESGLVRHIGFSVYETDEAKSCAANGVYDFMQVPFSVLDQRMATGGALSAAAAKGMTVHARSAFVQGLALMEENEVPERLAAARPLVRRFGELCATTGVSRRTLALAFVRRRREISHLVFGVDNLEHLKENIAAFGETVPENVLDDAERIFHDVDSDLVMPNKWRKG